MSPYNTAGDVEEKGFFMGKQTRDETEAFQVWYTVSYLSVRKLLGRIGERPSLGCSSAGRYSVK